MSSGGIGNFSSTYLQSDELDNLSVVCFSLRSICLSHHNYQLDTFSVETMLSKLFVAATALFSLTSAQIDLSNPEGGELKGKYLDKEDLPQLNFDIDYIIEGKPNTGLIEIYTTEELTLNYTFTNLEEDAVHIVGVGGHFADPTDGHVLANITDAKVGPITLQPGETSTFRQFLGAEVPVGNYLLIPFLYVAKGSGLAKIGAKSVLAVVEDPPVSYFSPQMIILELLLIATLGVGVYFVYLNWGAAYLKNAGYTASATPTPTSAKSTGAAQIDGSWLPDHLKKTNKKKAN